MDRVSVIVGVDKVRVGCIERIEPKSFFHMQFTNKSDHPLY